MSSLGIVADRIRHVFAIISLVMHNLNKLYKSTFFKTLVDEILQKLIALEELINDTLYYHHDTDAPKIFFFGGMICNMHMMVGKNISTMAKMMLFHGIRYSVYVMATSLIITFALIPWRSQMIKAFRSEQHGCYCADDIFTWFCLSQNDCVLI